MNRIQSFAPVAAPDAHTLILGSMPGQASLAAGQYYAHPRNLFWPILGTIFEAPLPDLPYAERLGVLQQHRVALWDVLHSCERRGSLDSAIAESSIQPNNFAEFFRKHPGIVRVLFNGSLAESTFRRHVQPQLPACALRCIRLPSTSPAHAALDFNAKLARWREALSA